MWREQPYSSIINKIGFGGERTSNAFSIFNHPGHHSLSINNSPGADASQFLKVRKNRIIIKIIKVKRTWSYGAGGSCINYYRKLIIVGGESGLYSGIYKSKFGMPDIEGTA